MINFVKELRGNMSQREFAELVGTTQQTIQRYEAGRIPSIERLEQIAKACGKRLVITFKDIEK